MPRNNEKSKRDRTETLIVELPGGLKDDLARLAGEDGETMSHVVRRLIREAVVSREDVRLDARQDLVRAEWRRRMTPELMRLKADDYEEYFRQYERFGDAFPGT